MVLGVESILRSGLYMQTRIFILVLIGHELEQGARHGDGERLRVRYPIMLGSANAVHELAIAFGISAVLIGDEKIGAARDDLIQPFLRPPLPQYPPGQTLADV